MAQQQPPTTTDGLDVLIDDHRTADRLFTQLTAGSAETDVVQEIIQELSVHAAVEEQVLYPLVRREVPGGEDLAEHSLEEHQEVKDTLATIESLDPSSPQRGQLLQQLVSSVREHVDEEENDLFPRLRASVPAEQLQQMAGAIEKAKTMAPTHPHPKAPSTPPGNVVAGAAAAVMDKARDALRRD